VFVEDQLQKRYIWLSKSPQTSLVYFVIKKDRKRRMVQDYRHLNWWMVKNRYPLSLIMDILDRVEKKKVFTKLNLRWGYNNVRVKKGNEWKVAFTMYIGTYELTVIYFSLINPSTTFQTMINVLFYDIINQENTATFINNIIVTMDTKEEYDELVEEGWKRITFLSSQKSINGKYEK